MEWRQRKARDSAWSALSEERIIFPLSKSAANSGFLKDLDLERLSWQLMAAKLAATAMQSGRFPGKRLSEFLNSRHISDLFIPRIGTQSVSLVSKGLHRDTS